MIGKIQFFTAGCARSQISEKNLQKALQQLGIDIEFESIDDPLLFKEHGVSAFPAIKLDGRIVTEGVFLTVDRCKEILADHI